MSRRFFGTDGIRGTVGASPITPDFMLRLGHAVGRVLKTRDAKPTVLIGKDTRISGYMIESALEAGFASAGVDVMMTGPLPTPGVAYLTRALRLSLGVVISASHNPFPDNGIKFFSERGEKLPDAWEEQVETMLDEAPQWLASAELGKARKLEDARGRYIEFCKSTFSPELSDLTLYVIDVAGGEKIPRKGGPGITRSDLLIINKTDLAPHVGANLDIMASDAKKQRGDRPFIFTNLRKGTGVAEVIAFIRKEGLLDEARKHRH